MLGKSSIRELQEDCYSLSFDFTLRQGFHQVAEASLERVLPLLASRAVRTTGLCHTAWIEPGTLSERMEKGVTYMT